MRERDWRALDCRTLADLARHGACLERGKPGPGSAALAKAQEEKADQDPSNSPAQSATDFCWGFWVERREREMRGRREGEEREGLESRGASMHGSRENRAAL